MNKRTARGNFFFILLGFYYGFFKLCTTAQGITAYKYSNFWFNSYRIPNDLLPPEIYITSHIIISYTLLLGTVGIIFKKSMGRILYLISMVLYIFDYIGQIIGSMVIGKIPVGKEYLGAHLMFFLIIVSIFYFTRPKAKEQFK